MIAMARILAIYRVLLDGSISSDEAIQRIRKELEDKGFKLEGYDENPIGFGIVALNLKITAPEEDGITDAISSVLEELEGVSSVELDMVSRVG
ncbi:Translation elongation factor EF1B, beta and delta chains, guanine nucleotide exchange [Candidatus Korarchaeum cryptofilum OPF8]|uniref:Elongation factor 1-beta n=1 Tax=Korarchaeum cryptofilum (strain OPF8) TaxID=374847 RepID=EF1B_KORCO|nr:RecName: Full=Elongation factor 1-beta; Short=EF-1-beta; AltName: Full=aEF-1beta [Candidatus Korarchaeum cryptofilum OPF8]ACB08146.1 Translation elongation factor EF1B, beta and delta chains, guanine nucleotide exchange [Candidatus Korarchaeum cryptofilum OPF8]